MGVTQGERSCRMCCCCYGIAHVLVILHIVPPQHIQLRVPAEERKKGEKKKKKSQSKRREKSQREEENQSRSENKVSQSTQRKEKRSERRRKTKSVRKTKSAKARREKKKESQLCLRYESTCTPNSFCRTPCHFLLFLIKLLNPLIPCAHPSRQFWLVRSSLKTVANLFTSS